jgi:hypothetical protein
MAITIIIALHWSLSSISYVLLPVAYSNLFPRRAGRGEGISEKM